MSSNYLRRYFPLALLWIPLGVLTLNYYTGEPADLGNIISLYGTIVLAFMLSVATAAYLIRAFTRMSELTKEKKIGEEIILEVGTLLLFIAILVVAFTKGDGSDEYAWITNYMWLPAEACAWGFAPLYFSAAAYRTWRVKSIESFLLVVSFISVLVASAPMFGVWPWTQSFGYWLLEYSKGPLRVLQIGAGIGIILMVVRAALGRHALLT